MKLFKARKKFLFLKRLTRAPCIQRGLFSLIILLFLSSISYAQSKPTIESSLKDLANKVMDHIYVEILNSKNQYPGLKDFGPESLLRNQYGIDVIQYKEASLDSQSHPLKKPLKFGVTIVGLNDTYFDPGQYSFFNFGFDLLELKFTGYQQGTPKDGFDIQKLIEKYGQELWEQQLKKLPLQLSIKLDNDQFNVGEPIEFTVTLTNTSRTALKVKDLNLQSIALWYNNEKISASDPVKTKEIVLAVHKSIVKKFQIEGFAEAGPYKIFVDYVMTFKGINPTATIIFDVVTNEK